MKILSKSHKIHSISIHYPKNSCENQMEFYLPAKVQMIETANCKNFYRIFLRFSKLTTHVETYRNDMRIHMKDPNKSDNRASTCT